MTNIPADFSWEVFRKNLKTLRKHYRLRQEDIAQKAGFTRSAYQHCETKGTGSLLIELCDLWYNNYSITPNDLLIKELNENDILKIERRIKFENMNKKAKVRIRRK